MPYLKELKQKAKLARNGPKCTGMQNGALKILKFYPDLALQAKMAALPLSLVPAIDTFVPATSNLNKNPANM